MTYTKERVEELLKQQRELCQEYVDDNFSALAAPSPPLPEQKVDSKQIQQLADKIRETIACCMVASTRNAVQSDWDYDLDFTTTELVKLFEAGKDKLYEVDETLREFEDWMHGEDGKKVTHARKLIIELLK